MAFKDYLYGIEDNYYQVFDIVTSLIINTGTYNNMY